MSFIDLFGLDTLGYNEMTDEQWTTFDSKEDVLTLDAVDVSTYNNGSRLNNTISGTMWGINTAVGGVSTYTAYLGKYYKWNEIWHQTKTRGTAWRWQSRWNRGLAPRVRAEQVKSVADARNLSGKLTKVGGVVLVADIVFSGELKPSHAINATMLGVSMTGVGAIAAGTWFIADFGTMGVNYLIHAKQKV